MPEARRNFLAARGCRFRLAADASFLRFRAGFAAFRTAGVFASVVALAKSNSMGFFIERVRIIAELPFQRNQESFWKANSNERARFLAMFEKAGAKAVYAVDPPRGVLALGGTGWSIEATLRSSFATRFTRR
jgi:hypothetical protein